MTTIRITDMGDDGCLAFDLADLLALIGDPAAESHWVCTVDSIVPKAGVKYVDLAFVGEHLFDGAVLFQLASNTLQVQEGTFKAVRAGENTPWLTLEAYDTTWWEVTSKENSVLDAIRGHFRNVETTTSE